MGDVKKLNRRIRRVTNNIRRMVNGNEKEKLIKRRKMLIIKKQRIMNNKKSENVQDINRYINDNVLESNKNVIQKVKNKINSLKNNRMKNILLNFLKTVINNSSNYVVESINDLFNNYNLSLIELISINLYLQVLLNLSNVIKNKDEEKIKRDVAYIIPYKHSDIFRFTNLLIVINHTLIKFKNIKIYITEQDKESNLKKNTLFNKLVEDGLIEHNLLYRDIEGIDRGNIFNCTIKHFIGDEDVIIMGDCDMPLLNNISMLVNLVRSKKVSFVSPYIYLSKLNKKESMNFLGNLKINHTNISSLFTFSGGILIVDKEEFIKLGMWYEYNYYGNEDRTMDVILEKLIKINKCYRDNSITYIHLWHPHNKDNIMDKIKENSEFRRKVFGCGGHNNKINIHGDCSHNDQLIWYDIYKNQNKGNLYKYKNENKNENKNNNEL